ncbi:MAG: TIGR00266 family protein [Coriobacteriales bacterium]
MQYEILGGNFPAVVCQLKAGESMKNESGAMLWMDPCIEMGTSGGGVGKVFGRMFSGETLFLNEYTARQDGKIAFGACVPGEILPVRIEPGRELIVQKNGFLACEAGVELSTHINEKLGKGVFGGEGFIMQRLSGEGTAFIECDGGLVEYLLESGQQLIVDTGHVLAFDKTVSFEIQRIKGAKNIVLGGEGLFHTKLTGPGRIWLQTMPITGLAQAIQPFIITS